MSVVTDTHIKYKYTYFYNKCLYHNTVIYEIETRNYRLQTKNCIISEVFTNFVVLLTENYTCFCLEITCLTTYMRPDVTDFAVVNAGRFQSRRKICKEKLFPSVDGNLCIERSARNVFACRIYHTRQWQGSKLVTAK